MTRVPSPFRAAPSRPDRLACPPHAAPKPQSPPVMSRFVLLLSLAALAHGATTPTETPAALGAAHLAKGEAEAAVAAYEKAVELDPKSSALRHQLGQAYGLVAQSAGTFARIGWARKMCAAYEKAIELDPENMPARQSLLGFYQMAPSMMGGGLDKARAQAAAIQRRDPVRGHVAHGMIHQSEKKYAEAAAEFEAALLAAPDDYAALFQIGRTAALSGERLDRGLETLRRCLALPPPAGAPGHDAAHWRLGNLWERKGDKPAARAAYQASLAVNPGFRQTIDALRKLDRS